MSEQTKRIIIVGDTKQAIYLKNLITELYQNLSLEIIWMPKSDMHQLLKGIDVDIIIYTGESPMMVKFFGVEENSRPHVITYYDSEKFIADIMHDLDVHLFSNFYFKMIPNYSKARNDNMCRSKKLSPSEKRLLEAEVEMSNEMLEWDIVYSNADKLFFEADYRARRKAGLVNEAGSYTFICPNCQGLCKGSWVWSNGELHGSTGCDTCGIRLMV